MKTTEYITNKINRFPKGYVFTYEDFSIEVERKEAVIKALNRMVEAGKISKLSKGKYYKPEKTPFGELQPDQEQVVKDLLEDDGKPIGYLTGYSIYNKLGLTSQVSNTIQIGRNEVRPKFKRERYTISFIKQKNIITRQNIPLLQILDSIRYIKKIPDSTLKGSLERLLKIIEKLSDNDKKELVRLSLKYPPSTRALLGAMLDELNEVSTKSLKASLNPITKYKIPGASRILSNTNLWNII
ncbi:MULTISPECIES: DUF6088 family protein [Salegentibacter]|uniref:Transcriptional regulator, AbiEi antitoxin, Type IV TA system n=1 Tax=Salegentibacter agarivorans TaxID=345907 RepID=A0A1I2Q9F8_9FLAO|nr:MULTISPECIES: DUF6088 family protein [Salegentibacter]SFG24283.1 hypothetical protein SAMN04488033_1463 [Salegentibacter agarivorans]